MTTYTMGCAADEQKVYRSEEATETYPATESCYVLAGGRLEECLVTVWLDSDRFARSSARYVLPRTTPKSRRVRWKACMWFVLVLPEGVPTSAGG
jgi:hypothetical protein